MKQHTGYIKGMHCAACKILIEDIVINHPDIHKTSIEMHTATIIIETQSDRPIGEIFQELQSDIIKHGYTLSSERFLSEKQKTNNFFALFFGIIILSVFFYLQKSGILNIGIGGGVTPISSFMIGLVASVSSCLAIVG
jgi:copper chaperone CopZ